MERKKELFLHLFLLFLLSTSSNFVMMYVVLFLQPNNISKHENEKKLEESLHEQNVFNHERHHVNDEGGRLP